MKKFLAVLLTLSIICSLIVIAPVSAAVVGGSYIELDESNIISFSLNTENSFVAEGTPTEVTGYPVSNLLDGDTSTMAVVNYVGRSKYRNGHSKYKTEDPELGVWDENDQVYYIHNEVEDAFLAADLVIDLGASYKIAGIELSFPTDDQVAEIGTAYPDCANLQANGNNAFGVINFYKENPLTSSETPFKASKYNGLINGFNYDDTNEYRYIKISSVWGNYACFLNEIKVKEAVEGDLLFKEAYTTTVTDQDFTKWSNPVDFAVGSATGVGSIGSIVSKESGTYTDSNYSYEIQQDGALKIHMDYPTAVARPYIVLDINPSNVDSSMKQISTTFKIKRELFDKNGSKVETLLGTGTERVELGSRVCLSDGKIARMYAAYMDNLGGMYKLPSGVKIGNCTAGGGYGRTDGTEGGVPVVGDDGYYNLEIRSWLASGEYYSGVYDLNNGGKMLKRIWYNKSSAGIEHNAVGAFIKLHLYGTSIRGYTSDVYLKDVKTTYEYAAFGSVAAAGSTKYTYDAETDTYSICNKPATGASGHRVKFNSGTNMTTGYAVMDFKLKVDPVITNEEGTNSSSYKLYTPDGSEICQFTSTQLGAGNTAGYVYDVAAGTRVNAMGITFGKDKDGWFNIRVVALNKEDGGKWGYAIYDLNSSYGAAKPRFLRTTNESTFKGFAFGYYLYGDGRGSCSFDSTIARKELPYRVKDFRMYTSTEFDNVGLYTRELYSVSGSPHTAWEKDADGNRIAVRFNGTVYMHSNNDAKIVLALYDEAGNEVKRTVKPLLGGVYEFGKGWNYSSNSTQSKITNIDLLVDVTDIDTEGCYPRYYITTGDGTWFGENGEYVVGNASFETSAEFGYAAEGDALKTLRFYFTPSFKTTMAIENFGAYIIPLGMFDADDVTGDSTELVTATGAGIDASTLVSGEIFAVELNDVPNEHANTTVVGIPFITIDGEYVWGDRLDVVPANVGVKAE